MRLTIYLPFFISQIIIISFLIFCFYMAGRDYYDLYGVAAYIILILILRNIVSKSHRKGMRLVGKKKFEEAIPLFEKSYNFFTNNAWVDRFRFITLLSSSKMCYKEMSLNNVAFCYTQINNGQKAIEYYNRLLQEYPNNSLAQTALRMIQAVKSPN